MSISALTFDDDGIPVDPDVMKMPESAPHSRTIDLLVVAASHLLGPDVWVFSDLNWYPPDQDNPIAPDLMILPRAAVDQPSRSYRQDQTEGPVPLVVVEVVSDSDTFASMRAMTHRYQALGVVAYVVVLDGVQGLLRFGPDDTDLVSWTGRPIPELGGFSVDFVDGVPQLTQPNGTTATTVAGLVATAEDRAATAEDRADRAEVEIEALRARLRALGADPGQNEPS